MSRLSEKELFCPVCNQMVNSSFIFQTHDRFDNSEDKSIFKIYECQQCGLRITYPPIPEEEIHSYYRYEEYDPHLTARNRSGLKVKLYLIVRDLQYFVKYHWIHTLKSTGRFCDYGASTGEFVEFMQKRGYQATGFEMSEQAVRYAREKGRDIRPSVEFFSTEDKFDLITFWHVLEHLSDPGRLLDRCHTLLSPGGILVIALPNYQSVDAQHYQEQWIAYDTPRHYYHFQPETLKTLVESFQFRLLHTRPLLPDTPYNSLLSEEQRGSHLFYRLGKVLYISWLTYFQILINGIERSSSLVYFFKKRQ